MSDTATTRAAAARSLFVALSELPKQGRNTRKRGLRASVPTNAIEFAARYLDTSNGLTMIQAWLDEDHPNPNRVGRPQSIPTRAYLVAALACSLAGLPITYAQVHHVLTDDLPRATRSTLGLPVDDDPEVDARAERARKKISYYALTRLAAKVGATFDPKVYPVKRGLTSSELNHVDRERDPVEVARKQKRSDSLCSALLLPAWDLLPSDVRAKWSGDITLDATVVKVYGKRGHPSKKGGTSRFGRRLANRADSPEANAGWHAKTQDKRDAAHRLGTSEKSTEYTFGYDAHLALTTGEGVGREFPALLLGLSLDTPGFQPGENAVAAVAGIQQAGLPCGALAVDLGYSQMQAKNFHLPMRALGYSITQMYKVTELGIQANHEGAILVEGTWYGPCLPRRLIDATEDYRAGRITESVYRSMIEGRRPYALRMKSVARDGVTFVRRCPAQGQGRTMGCELQPKSLAVPKGARPLPLVVNPPRHPSAVCTNKSSITIPLEIGAKYWQPLPYESPEWRAAYTGPRNQIEAKNRYIKNGVDAAIADPDQRRFRGLGKQVFAMLTKLIAANVQTVLAFLDRGEREESAPAPKQPGRKPKAGLEQYLPQPHAPPVRIAGRRLTDNPKAA